MANLRGQLASIAAKAAEIEKALPKDDFPTAFVLEPELAAVEATLDKLNVRATAIVREHKAQVAERAAEAEAAAARQSDEAKQKATIEKIADAVNGKKHKEK